MVKGFNQKSDDITQEKSVNLKKGFSSSVGSIDTVEVISEENTSKPILGTKSKDISHMQKSSDFQAIERNNVLKLLYDARLKSIERLKNIDVTDEQNVKFIKMSVKMLLSSVLAPLQRNMNLTSLATALTPYVVISVVVPEIHNDIPMIVYDRLEPLARKYADTDVKYKAFYDKCIKLKEQERLPFVAETAAQAEISLFLRYYEDMRKPGITDDDRKDIEISYQKRREKLEQIFTNDNVDMMELKNQNHIISISMIKSDARLKRMFSYVYDNHAVNLDVIERSYSTIVNEQGRPVTSSVYRIPLGGLVYADGGHTFPYRFGPRNIYTPNMYDDMMFIAMRTHYGQAYKAYHSDDKSYLKSEDYLKSLSYAYEIKALMIDDGYTEEQAMKLVEAVHTRCELYYRTEDPIGIEEWLREHPEDADKYRKPQKAVVDNDTKIDLKHKSHIKIKKKDLDESKNPQSHEWAIAPSDPLYEPMIRAQEGWALTRPLNDTFTETDLKCIAIMMHELEYALNPHSKKYQVEETFDRLMMDAESELREFLRVYRSEEMNYYKRRIYDTLKVMTKTEAPAIDSDNFLVAVRCIFDLVEIGDIGGRVHGKVSVAPGCFVDNKSGIDNSELSGNVVVLMRTSIKSSKITGNGIIVNSDITNCNLSGTFNEYDMRIKMDEEHSSPVHILKMSGLTEDFGEYLEDESVDIGLKRIRTHGYEYMNKTIEEYINIWQGKHHAKMVFNRNLTSSDEDETVEDDSANIVLGQKHFYGGSKTEDETESDAIDESLKESRSKTIDSKKSLNKDIITNEN